MIHFMSMSSEKQSSRLIRSVTERVRQSSLIPIFRVVARLIRSVDHRARECGGTVDQEHCLDHW